MAIVISGCAAQITFGSTTALQALRITDSSQAADRNISQLIYSMQEKIIFIDLLHI